MRGESAWCLLRMLDERCVGQWGALDVLEHLSAERHCQHLDAAADAQDGDVAVVGEACQEQFRIVAHRTDFSQSFLRVFAPAEWVDVGSARKEEAIDAVEQGGEQYAVFRCRDNHGYAARLFHATKISLSQRASPLSVHVSRDADDGTRRVVGIMVRHGAVFVDKVKMIHGCCLDSNRCSSRFTSTACHC